MIHSIIFYSNDLQHHVLSWSVLMQSLHRFHSYGYRSHYLHHLATTAFSTSQKSCILCRIDSGVFVAYTVHLLISFITGSLSCRNQSIDLLYKSMEWFPYHRDLRHERANQTNVTMIDWLLYECNIGLIWVKTIRIFVL